MLLRDGVLVAADHVLDPITPTVGLWPESRPDPLGDYLGGAGAHDRAAPRIALPGHGELIVDPSGCARELIAHHGERLAATAAALGEEPRTGYEVSLPLFGRASPGGTALRGRRDALAPRAARPSRGGPRHEDVGVVSYTAA